MQLFEEEENISFGTLTNHHNSTSKSKHELTIFILYLRGKLAYKRRGLIFHVHRIFYQIRISRL